MVTFGKAIPRRILYLLFHIIFQTATLGSKLNPLYALAYPFPLRWFRLQQVFTAVALVQLVLRIFSGTNPVVAGLAASVVLLVGVVFVAPRLEVLDEFREDVSAVFDREENGLTGRYSVSGGLSSDLDYIAEHPFQPIGLGFSQKSVAHDSAPALVKTGAACRYRCLLSTRPHSCSFTSI